MWKQRKGNNATYENLAAAFESAHCKGYAEHVKRVIGMREQLTNVQGLSTVVLIVMNP